MLALPVEKSREQRQQRLQARFRDRGGIFVPSEKNALIDILLARSVTGESPRKRARPRKQQGFSPVREKGEGKFEPLATDGEQVGPAPDVASLANGKSKDQTKKSRKPSNEPGGKAPKEDHDDGLPTVGPDNKAEVTMKSARSGKGKARAEVIAVPSEEPRVPKRIRRLPKKAAQPKGIHADDDDDDRKDHPVHPAPKPRDRPPKSKPQNQPSRADTLDDTVHTEEAPVKSKRVPKNFQYPADSDMEDDGAASDYTPISRKRPKSKQAAPAKSAATAVRRKKPVQVTQPDDSDDSSAIIITAKRKAVKTDSVQNLAYPKKPFSDVRIGDDEDNSLRRPKPKPQERAKPQTPKKRLYLDDDDDEDSETTQVNLPAHKGHGVKVKVYRAPTAVEDGHDGAAKSKCRTRSIKPSKTVAAPDTDGEEGQVDPPPNHASQVKIKSSASQAKAKNKTDAKDSGKRLRGVADAEHVSDSEGFATPPPTRKRSKTIASPISDDETLVEPALSKVGSPKVAKGKSPKIAKNSSRTLKENAIARKGKSASQKTKQTQPKLSHDIARKGPPPEVLSRIKARPPSSPLADSDTDPIDFLS